MWGVGFAGRVAIADGCAWKLCVDVRIASDTDMNATDYRGMDMNDRSSRSPVGVATTGAVCPRLNDRQWYAIGNSLRLTDRERQVVWCLLQGKCQASIAEALDISSHTVHTHLDRLYRKLGIKGRFDLLLRIFAEYVYLSEVMA